MADLSALRIRDFRFYTASRFLSSGAQTLLQATIAWQVFQISGSALQLGLVGLVRFLPALIASLYAGAVADVHNRRTIVLVAELAPLASSLALMLLTLEKVVTLPLIYLLVLLIALGSAFEWPARQALLPQIVPAKAFAKAVTFVSTIQQLAFVSGPVLGGLVIARLTVSGAYGVHAALVAVAMLGLVPIQPRGDVQRGGRVTFELIKEGIAFVRHSQVLLGSMTLDMFGVVFGGAEALLPIYAQKILNVGAGGYGLLSSSLGLGALAMGLALLFLPPIKRGGMVLLYAVACFGLTTMLFGASRSFAVSVVAYALTGAADQVSMLLRQAIVQLATPDGLRGRVSSVSSLFVGASNEVGMVESGLVAAATNATVAVVSGGAACLAVVAAIAATMPDLRRYRLDYWSGHAETTGFPRDVAEGALESRSSIP